MLFFGRDGGRRHLVLLTAALLAGTAAAVERSAARAEASPAPSPGTAFTAAPPPGKAQEPGAGQRAGRPGTVTVRERQDLAPARHRTTVVLSPHPDDETLTLGVWIADAVERGDRVILVNLTDGRSTGAGPAVAARLGHPLTRDQIAQARIREVTAAAARLGIAPADLRSAHLDAEGSPGGTRITEAEVAAVINDYARRYPTATFATMSWLADRHPDHVNAGRALWRAEAAGQVQDSVFAVSRLWWKVPTPTPLALKPESTAARSRVLGAATEYARWDPARRRYAVGVASVKGQFAALRADPQTRIHSWSAQNPPPAEPSVPRPATSARS